MHEGLSEGERVWRILRAADPYPRDTAPEPSLLPHLAATLAHEGDGANVLRAAGWIASGVGRTPPWPALWEATLFGLVRRFPPDAPLFEGFRPAAEVVAVLARHDVDAARLLYERIEAPHPTGPSLRARLAPLLSLERLVDDFLAASVDPADLDAEAVRSLLEAAQARGLPPPAHWVERALDGAEFPPSRHAHLVPFLPEPHRAGLAVAAARGLLVEGPDPGPDFQALVLSRLGSFLDTDAREMLLTGLPDCGPPWAGWIRELAHAPWPDAPHADVFRAHPYGDELARVERPHESSFGAADAIADRYGPPQAAFADRRAEPRMEPGAVDELDVDDDILAPPGASAPTAAPPDAPAPPAPRALQADVLLDGQRVVDAFVARRRHVVEVSIGRGARVRLDAPLPEPDFPADVDVLELPVWFAVGESVQSGTLRLPRDRSRNSSPARFELTAPPAGPFVAQVVVLRPGGTAVLQAALLLGRVVSTPDEAVGHAPGLELRVNAVPGLLDDPLPASAGATVVTDGEHALAGPGGVPVFLDVSQLQRDLTDLVARIEWAAEREDIDPRAVEKVLVELAIAGQRLRAQIADGLARLAREPRLQIVSTRARDVLPLELIYEGPLLSATSALCSNWRQAVADDSCAACPGGGPDADPEPRRVCPRRFWALTKVIERRSAGDAATPFRVFGERRTGLGTLRPIDAVLLGASGRVEPAALADLRQKVGTLLGAPVELASDWKDWQAKVGVRHPELLIALPHNDTVGEVSSALRLGEPKDEPDDALHEPRTEILAGGVTRAHVQLTDDRPGPIVLLLGCSTQFETSRLSGFSGEFKDQGAALTVATMGRLRSDHAPGAAATILRLLGASARRGATMGDVLRDARQKMLGEGMIMSLLLVGNGDADWLLPGARGGLQ